MAQADEGQVGQGDLGLHAVGQLAAARFDDAFVGRGVEEIPARLEGLADQYMGQAVAVAPPQAQRIAGKEAQCLASAGQADMQLTVAVLGEPAHLLGHLVGGADVVCGAADVGQRLAVGIAQHVDVFRPEGDWRQAVVEHKAMEPARLV